MTTAMQAAFEQAHYEHPRDSKTRRLMEVAVEAWATWPATLQAAARRDHVKQHISHETTWILLERYQPQALSLAISQLLADAEKLIRAQRPQEVAGQRPVNGGGHEQAGTQLPSAPADPSRDAGKPAGDDQEATDTHASCVVAPFPRDHPAPSGRDGNEPATRPATPKSPPPAVPPSDAARDALRVSAAIANHNEMNKLDAVFIDGVRIGDCSAGVVRKWAEGRMALSREAGRDARFGFNLAANLENHAIIRDWWRDKAEVNRMYARAEADYAA